MGFEFTELVEFYCIFGKPQPQANILHYSPYTQLVRSEKIPKKQKQQQQHQQLGLFFSLMITYVVFQHYLKSSLLSPMFFLHEDKCELVMVNPLIATK